MKKCHRDMISMINVNARMSERESVDCVRGYLKDQMGQEMDMAF